jgi:hypothetical protein
MLDTGLQKCWNQEGERLRRQLEANLIRRLEKEVQNKVQCELREDVFQGLWESVDEVKKNLELKVENTQQKLNLQIGNHLRDCEVELEKMSGNTIDLKFDELKGEIYTHRVKERRKEEEKIRELVKDELAEGGLALFQGDDEYFVSEDIGGNSFGGNDLNDDGGDGLNNNLNNNLSKNSTRKVLGSVNTKGMSGLSALKHGGNVNVNLVTIKQQLNMVESRVALLQQKHQSTLDFKISEAIQNTRKLIHP